MKLFRLANFISALHILFEISHRKRPKALGFLRYACPRFLNIVYMQKGLNHGLQYIVPTNFLWPYACTMQYSELQCFNGFLNILHGSLSKYSCLDMVSLSLFATKWTQNGFCIVTNLPGFCWQFFNFSNLGIYPWKRRPAGFWDFTIGSVLESIQ